MVVDSLVGFARRVASRGPEPTDVVGDGAANSGRAGPKMNSVKQAHVQHVVVAHTGSGGVLSSLAQAEQIVRELVERSFPELANVPLEVRLGHFDGATSFHSRPDISSVLNPFAPRRYLVVVNEVALRRRMPVQVAEAVLAHELCHTVFYVRGGGRGLLRAAWSQVSRGYRRVFEWVTDLEAVRRGYGAGLAAYAEWLRPQLTAKARTAKEATYLSAAEIREAGRDPDAPIWAVWRAHWPHAAHRRR